MSKLIALSDGHGINTAGKRTPTLPNGQKSELGRKYMNENLFNRAVVDYLDKLLKDNGFRTLLVAPTDADTPLATRTNLANTKKADLYVAIHANALAGKWGSHGGIETFTWKSGDSVKLGKLVQAELIKGSPLKDRGVKDGSHLWEIRKPNMPAILVEAGFMDSTNDYKYLLTDAYRRETAIEVARGICKFYGVTFKNTLVKKKTPVKTVTGTYKVKSGDTLWEISRKFDITVSELKSINGLTSNTITVGQVLKLTKSTTKKTTVKKKSTSLPSNVYGTITVKASSLNVREKANFSSKVVKTIKKGQTFRVYGKKNGLYHLGGKQYCSAGTKYVSFKKNPKYKASKGNKAKTLTVLASSLWTYDKPNWNAKHKTVKKGGVYTIKKTLTVGGSKMYQLKSGLYITANPKFVKVNK